MPTYTERSGVNGNQTWGARDGGGAESPVLGRFPTRLGDDGERQGEEGRRVENKEPAKPFSPSLPDLKEGSAVEDWQSGGEKTWAEMVVEKRRRIDDAPVADYRPVVLRPYFILGLLTAVIAFIALVELSVRMLPNDNTLQLPKFIGDSDRVESRDYKVLVKRQGDRLEDQVLTIVEVTTLTVESLSKREIRPGQIAEPEVAGTEIISATVAIITPSLKLYRREDTHLKAYGAPFLTNTWIKLGSVTIEEVVWWTILDDGQARLFTSTSTKTDGGGNNTPVLLPPADLPDGGASPGAPRPPVETTEAATVIVIPDPTQGPTKPAAPGATETPKQTTFVYHSGTDSFTAVVGGPTPAPAASNGAAPAAGPGAAQLVGGSGSQQQGAGQGGQAGRPAGMGFSTLVYSTTDSQGHVVSRTMIVPIPTAGSESGNSGAALLEQQPAHRSAYVTTLRDASGKVTGVFTVVPNTSLQHTLVTLTDAAGVPTRTVTGDVVETTLMTMPPASTPTFVGSSTESKVYYISGAQYFTGAFLPTLLAMILSLFVRTLDLAAKRLEPFHALTREGGATAAESLCLENTGWRGYIPTLRSSLPALTTVAVLMVLTIAPLSSGVLGFETHGTCTSAGMGVDNCAITLAVFPITGRIVVAFLSGLIILLVAIILILRRWQSGVAADPWSIASIASLSSDRAVMNMFDRLPGAHQGNIKSTEILAALGDRRFKLAHFDGLEEDAYGIVAVAASQDLKPLQKGRSFSFKKTFSWKRERSGLSEAATVNKNTKHHLAFLMLSYTSRIVFLSFITGLLIVILYYATLRDNNSFERFMDSETFVVKFVFTLLGVIINLFWGAFFTCVAIMSPYKAMSSSPQPASRSVLLAPPTDPFTGLVAAVRRRQPFMVVVAATAILSEFLPVLLQQVPWHVTATQIAQLFGIWGSVAILCVMAAVVAGSFLVRWPYLPVDPSTVAGTMYYVYDSRRMVGRFEGLGTVGRRERDEEVNLMGGKYVLGERRDGRGREKMRVEVADEGRV